MKLKAFSILAAVAALTFCGCATKPRQPPPAPGVRIEEILALARPMAETFATAMLANNAQYGEVVCGVADGLALALHQAELTPDMVDGFTANLRREHRDNVRPPG